MKWAPVPSGVGADRLVLALAGAAARVVTVMIVSESIVVKCPCAPTFRRPKEVLEWIAAS